MGYPNISGFFLEPLSKQAYICLADAVCISAPPLYN